MFKLAFRPLRVNGSRKGALLLQQRESCPPLLPQPHNNTLLWLQSGVTRLFIAFKAAVAGRRFPSCTPRSLSELTAPSSSSSSSAVAAAVMEHLLAPCGDCALLPL